jgi:hypothetical protein
MDIRGSYQRQVAHFRIHQLRREQWINQQKNNEIPAPSTPSGVAPPTISAVAPTFATNSTTVASDMVSTPPNDRNIDAALQSIDPAILRPSSPTPDD